MKTQIAYCSACDKDVSIVITDQPSHDGHANLHDAEVVCLEIGDNCTGNMCPIGATSAAVMTARLIRSGLNTLLQPVVTAHCSDCGRATSHFLVDATHATCGECGATSARSELVIVTNLE